MNITIAGGGNVGTQFAVHCAEKGHRVTIYTSKPKSFEKDLVIVNENGRVIHKGRIARAVMEPEEAFTQADIIFVTVPAHCISGIADKIYPHIKKGVKIGLIPGSGGGECAFKECAEKGAVIFGLQRVPSVARLVRYGSSVCATGYRERLHAAALPSKEAQGCCEILGRIFNIPCVALPEYLDLTMTPSNPVLHTVRLRTLFRDYCNGMRYDTVPLFYEEWDQTSSELLLRCDEEVQDICKNLKEFDLSGVRPLKEHYESDTAERMTQKISSIPAFQGLRSPTVEIDGKFIPDLDSRYFTADFPYGLSILVQIADLSHTDVPNMKEILRWYHSISTDRREFQYADYGIRSYEEFVRFYKQ